MIVDSAHFLRGVRQRGPLTVTEAAARPRSGGSFVWLEFHEPAVVEMEALRDGFGLHELAVEDAMRAHQRPKVEAYDDFYFLVFRTARNSEDLEHVLFGEVHVFLGVGFVIAIRHGDAGSLTTATAHDDLLRHGPAAVVWGILDAIVRDLRPVVEEIENDIETLEHAIFNGQLDGPRASTSSSSRSTTSIAPCIRCSNRSESSRTAASRTSVAPCCATSATPPTACAASTRRYLPSASSSTASSTPTRR